MLKPPYLNCSVCPIRCTERNAAGEPRTAPFDSDLVNRSVFYVAVRYGMDKPYPLEEKP